MGIRSRGWYNKKTKGRGVTRASFFLLYPMFSLSLAASALQQRQVTQGMISGIAPINAATRTGARASTRTA